MFSQFDNEEVEDYFDRLNAQLRKMPLEDRREMHQELRQHLDALAAAHEELGASPGEALRRALVQFGEPTQVGQRLMREWRLTTNKTHGSPWRLVSSVGVGQAIAWAAAVAAFMVSGGGIHFHASVLMAVISSVFEYAPPIVAGTIIGFRLSRRAIPEQTVPPALYASLVSFLCMDLMMSLYTLPARVSINGASTSHYLIPINSMFGSSVVECLVAYAACAYKRDGRRLRLADWKLLT